MTSNSARVLIGFANQMETRLPRLRCSWPSTYFTRTGAPHGAAFARSARPRLEKAVAGSKLVLPARRLAKNGFEAWAEVIAHDYEGLVAKEEASLYEAGPTRRWLKVKQKGWTVGEDRWQRRISTGA